MSGCRERGIPEKKATKIFEFIEFFAGYGFNKSHSTTYALLAYQTAYLKANYPRHFMAALLTIESQNSDKIALYLAECRELGVPVLPPDINASALAVHRPSPSGVRFGLGAVKGAGEGAIRLDPRRRATALGGRIPSLFALVEHVDLRLVNKKVLESLVKAGAFDSLAPERPRDAICRGAPRLLRRPRSHPRSRRPAPARSRSGPVAALRRRRADRGGAADDAALPAVAAVDGDRGADVREGSARPLHERASAPALCRGARDAGRAAPGTI